LKAPVYTIALGMGFKDCWDPGLLELGCFETGIAYQYNRTQLRLTMLEDGKEKYTKSGEVNSELFLEKIFS